jgi:hypothetical protein
MPIGYLTAPASTPAGGSAAPLDRTRSVAGSLLAVAAFASSSATAAAAAPVTLAVTRVGDRRSVMTLNRTTGRLSRLYRGRFAPRGLALMDGRLVWWIDGRHGSRILRLPLP